MRTKSYNDYIKSPDWENRKTQFKTQHPKRCFVCNAARQVELHHLSYIRLGHENDEDLCWLCLSHHIEVHSLIKKSSATLAQAHYTVRSCHRKLRYKPKTRQLRRPRQFNLKRITELFDICIEILSFHGIEPDWSDYELSDTAVCKSISYMYNVLIRGGSWYWQGDLLCSSLAIYLDPSQVDNSEYWHILQELERKLEKNKRKEMRQLATARRIKQKNRRIKNTNDLYNKHIQEARIENRRLG